MANALRPQCLEFFEHYFVQETGYLRAVPRWGGNDGPDDAAENGLNWTVLVRRPTLVLGPCLFIVPLKFPSGCLCS
eukprot:SAG22_NODE_2173_length_2893_cov_3.127774_1_plen_76_part_00